jgi:hypothetical protein
LAGSGASEGGWGNRRRVTPANTEHFAGRPPVHILRASGFLDVALGSAVNCRFISVHRFVLHLDSTRGAGSLLIECKQPLKCFVVRDIARPHVGGSNRRIE